jgi:hypothetical protein
VANHIAALEREFTKMGHEVKVISPAPKGNGLTGSFEVKQPLSPVEPINWWLIGGIIAAVVVVGLLVFSLVRRRSA